MKSNMLILLGIIFVVFIPYAFAGTITYEVESLPFNQTYTIIWGCVPPQTTGCIRPYENLTFEYGDWLSGVDAVQLQNKTYYTLEVSILVPNNTVDGYYTRRVRLYTSGVSTTQKTIAFVIGGITNGTEYGDAMNYEDWSNQHPVCSQNIDDMSIGLVSNRVLKSCRCEFTYEYLKDLLAIGTPLPQDAFDDLLGNSIYRQDFLECANIRTDLQKLTDFIDSGYAENLMSNCNEVNMLWKEHYEEEERKVEKLEIRMDEGYVKNTTLYIYVIVSVLATLVLLYVVPRGMKKIKIGGDF